MNEATTQGSKVHGRRVIRIADMNKEKEEMKAKTIQSEF